MNVARLGRLRDALLTRDLCRNAVNDRIDRTKQIFNGGEENLGVPPDVAASVRSLKPLEIDRSSARETEPARPVSDRDARLTALNASQTIADLIETIRYTRYATRRGAQPNLVAANRYKPVDHKTRRQSKVRGVPTRNGRRKRFLNTSGRAGRADFLAARRGSGALRRRERRRFGNGRGADRADGGALYERRALSNDSESGEASGRSGLGADARRRR